MELTQHQKSAIQEAAKQYSTITRLGITGVDMNKQRDFTAGAKEVITNPSKFGLVSSTPSNGEIILAQSYHRITAENQRYKEALESIRDYWNQDRNDEAMHSACWHAHYTADEALKGGDQ